MTSLQEDQTKKGIWRYHHYFPQIDQKFWLSLEEGATPLIQIEQIYFKREDLNPTGSLKDRGLAYQVSKAYSEGEKNLVIPSSGNAAIAAAAYCQLAGINLTAFVPGGTPKGKLKEIKKFGGEVKVTDRSLSDSIQFSRQKGFKNLRPSVDPAGIEGYKTIAFEIYKNLGRVDDLFLPVSSATCLVGMAEGFQILGFLPRIHACQSTAVNSIAAEFDQDFGKTSTSLATALVARLTPRKSEALKVINQSRGWGWVVGDGDKGNKRDKGDKGVREGTRWLEEREVETSVEGALALAAIWKAQDKGWELGKTVCLLTGRKY